MSMSSGIGVSINTERKNHAYYFGEDQGRYLVEVDAADEQKFKQVAEDHKITIELIGRTIDAYLMIQDIGKVSVKDLKSESEKWFPNFTR